MEFELAMRLLFGQKGYHIAGSELNPASRREWLEKTVRKLLRVVNDLDTTLRHKQVIMSELDTVFKLLKGGKDASWALVYRLLRVIMRLLGYDFLRGSRCHTLIYHQTPEQHRTSIVLDGGNPMQDYYDQKSAVAVRQQIVKRLKREGLDDFKISLVLNTNEYEVKRLRSNRSLQGTRRKRRAPER
jgi:hypothetical protein